MLVRMLAAAVFSLSLSLSGMTIMADDNVPLPKLPEGAGKTDADAPKTFTKTASGLQYRFCERAPAKSRRRRIG